MFPFSSPVGLLYAFEDTKNMRIIDDMEDMQHRPLEAPTQSMPAPVQPDSRSAPDGRRLPDRLTLARWMMVAALLALIGWLLWSALPTLQPFIIGLVIAYLLLPLVNRLSSSMPRWAAILVTYICGGVLLYVAFSYLIPLLGRQIGALLDSIPTLVQLQQWRDNLFVYYDRYVPPAFKPQIEQGLDSATATLQGNIADYVQRASAFLWGRVLALLNTFTFLLGFLSLPVWLYYVLSDEAAGRRFLDERLHPRLRADFWNVFSIINSVFSSYIRGQLILCAAVGAAVGIGLLVLQMLGIGIGNYIFILSLIAGITEIIPVLGPTIGAIPAVLIAFTISPVAGFAVLAVYIIVQQLENSLLVPKIIGDSVDVHPAVLTVAMIVLGYLFGLIGIILASPAVAISRDLFVYVYRRLEGIGPQLALVSLRKAPPAAEPAMVATRTELPAEG